MSQNLYIFGDLFIHNQDLIQFLRSNYNCEKEQLRLFDEMEYDAKIQLKW